MQQWPDYPVYVRAVGFHPWWLNYKRQCERGQRRKLMRSSDIGALIACYNREDAERLCSYLHNNTLGDIDVDIVKAPTRINE